MALTYDAVKTAEEGGDDATARLLYKLTREFAEYEKTYVLANDG